MLHENSILYDTYTSNPLTLSQVLPLFTLVHFQFAPALVEITSLNGHKNLLEKVTFKQI